MAQFAVWASRRRVRRSAWTKLRGASTARPVGERKGHPRSAGSLALKQGAL